MFELNFKALGIKVESTLPTSDVAVTSKAKNAHNAYNAIREFIGLTYAGETIAADLDKRALVMLKPCKTVDAYNKMRDAHKALYMADYALRFPSKALPDSDEGKAWAKRQSDAFNTYWSRSVRGRAVAGGYVVPVSESKAAKAIAEKRADEKAAQVANGTAPVDGRTTAAKQEKTGATVTTTPATNETIAKDTANASSVNPSAIVGDKSPLLADKPRAGDIHAALCKYDADIAAIFAWANNDTRNRAALVEWFQSTRKGQLSRVA